MSPPSTWTATCWRDGTSWHVEVPELQLSANAWRLSDVGEVARRLVVDACGDGTACRVVVDPVVRHTLSELVEAAAAVRAEPDRVSVEAVTLRRGLARRLTAEGLDVHDVAALLGLSYPRALALVAETSHCRRPASPLPDPAVPVAAEPDQERNGMKPHRSYRHEAFLYRGEQEFLDETLPFLQEGLALEQPTLVLLRADRLALLRDALGSAADDACWLDMSEVGANPARILPVWRQFVDEHGGENRPVRGIGEPVWAERRAAELVECQLHEALLNVAIEPDTPLWLRCPYDADTLPDEVLEEAARSHPALVESGGYRGSTRYGGADHVSTVFTSALPEPVAEVEELVFDAETVDQVRRRVSARAVGSELPAGRTADLSLAVAEAATNSVRHGGGGGALRIWEQDGALVCEVRDAGRMADPLVGRRMPSLTGEGGRGLWLVHQLSDLAQVRSTPQGTTVRVVTWL